MPHNGCPCRCSFCSQHRITGVSAQPEPDEVRELLRRSALSLRERTQNTEIAFFGGSFTAIDRNYMISLLEAAREGVESLGFQGIRISTRPDKIDREVLELLKRYRVTSIELGAQSMSDSVLAANCRGHTVLQVETASNLIREFGFSLGLQMMTGLYASREEEDRETARKLADLRPDTVRIYPTVVLENTRLADLYRAGEYQPPGLEESVKLCAYLIRFFEEQGIKVIRVGLHDSRELQEGRVAGPYHPAFRELCLSRLVLEQLLEELQGAEAGEIPVRVNPKRLSQFVGQKKENLLRLRELGYEMKIIPDPETELYEIIERKPAAAGA